MEISFVHKIEKKKVYNRLEYIVEKCRGKRVLHVGACDHTQNVVNKMKSGTWMHSLINDVAASNIGIDINEEAIAVAKEME